MYVSTELSLRLYRATRYHAVAIAFLGALTVAWTWPLVLHLTTAVPGGAGDNYTFLWTLWWMRRALSDATISFFAIATGAFLIGTAPLLIQAIQLVRTGQYVSQRADLRVHGLTGDIDAADEPGAV